MFYSIVCGCHSLVRSIAKCIFENVGHILNSVYNVVGITKEYKNEKNGSIN